MRFYTSLTFLSSISSCLSSGLSSLEPNSRGVDPPRRRRDHDQERKCFRITETPRKVLKIWNAKKESFEVASKLHCIRQLEKQISVQGWLGWLWVFWGLPGGDPCAPAPGATERETAHGEAPCTTTTTRQGIECWIAYDDCRRSIILATNGLWPQHLVKTATLKSNSWCQYTAISGYMWMMTMYRWVGRKQREILNFRPLLWCVVQDWCIRLNKR